jgi:hypothetical protein
VIRSIDRLPPEKRLAEVRVERNTVRLADSLPATNRFLIVEYERSRPNRWGPYPVGFDKLRELFIGEGVERVEKLATRGSRFGGTLYSAWAERS